jgi:hypothetical protein
MACVSRVRDVVHRRICALMLLHDTDSNQLKSSKLRLVQSNSGEQDARDTAYDIEVDAGDRAERAGFPCLSANRFLRDETFVRGGRRPRFVGFEPVLHGRSAGARDGIGCGGGRRPSGSGASGVGRGSGLQPDAGGRQSSRCECDWRWPDRFGQQHRRRGRCGAAAIPVAPFFWRDFGFRRDGNHKKMTDIVPA